MSRARARLCLHAAMLEGPPSTAALARQGIRDRRRRLGLSQMKLAQRAGLALGTVSLAERGLLTARTARKLARVLRCQVSDLLAPEPAVEGER